MVHQLLLPLKRVKQFLGKVAKRGTKNNEVILFRGRSKYRMLSIIEKPTSHERIMYAGNRRFVAGINTKNNFPLNSPYFLADIVNPHPRSLLFLGGGPNALPSYLWRKYKPRSIDVVEHDELNTDLARRFFNLPKDKNYRIYHQDAIHFLKKTKTRYDIIYPNIGLTRKRGLSKGDLYGLCSLQGIRNIQMHLTKNGTLIFLMIGRLEGQDLIFERRCLTALKTVFPSVFVFSDFQAKKHKIQLIIFLATNKGVGIVKRYAILKSKEKLPQNEEIYEELLAKMHRREIIKPNLRPYGQ